MASKQGSGEDTSKTQMENENKSQSNSKSETVIPVAEHNPNQRKRTVTSRILAENADKLNELEDAVRDLRAQNRELLAQVSEYKYLEVLWNMETTDLKEKICDLLNEAAIKNVKIRSTMLEVEKLKYCYQILQRYVESLEPSGDDYDDDGPDGSTSE